MKMRMPLKTVSTLSTVTNVRRKRLDQKSEHQHADMVFGRRLPKSNVPKIKWLTMCPESVRSMPAYFLLHHTMFRPLFLRINKICTTWYNFRLFPNELAAAAASSNGSYLQIPNTIRWESVLLATSTQPSAVGVSEPHSVYRPTSRTPWYRSLILSVPSLDITAWCLQLQGSAHFWLTRPTWRYTLCMMALVRATCVQ